MENLKKNQVIFHIPVYDGSENTKVKRVFIQRNFGDFTKHLLGYDTSSYLLLFSAHRCNVPVKVVIPLLNVSMPKVVLTIRNIVNTYLEK